MSRQAPRWIMHVDMDAFFASVEQRDNAAYRDRPLVVGSLPGSRGVVATCSYEARKFGIRSAMPISEAYRRCPEAIYVKPDSARYREASSQIMVALGTVSPVVEPVSIDEAFLDISGLERLYGSPEAIGRLVKERIWQQVRLHCSVGIGPNRLIAKLASEQDKPDGLTVVATEAVERFLDPMPIANLRGVGPQTLKTVQRVGLHTVAQLRGLSAELLNQYFGEKAGASLYRQARGQASDQVGQRSERKSLSKETTFNEDVTDSRRLREAVHSLAAEVGRGLRRERLKGQVITLKVRLAGFDTYTRQRRLPFATDADKILFQVAWELFEQQAFRDRPIRLIGVSVSHWSDGQGQNLDLFSIADERERQQTLYTTLDRVNDRFGNGKLSLGLVTRKKR